MKHDHTELTESNTDKADVSLQETNTSVLPPDGKLIYASAWRQLGAWGILGLFIVGDLDVAILGFSLGNANGVALGLASLAVAGVFVRDALGGLMVEQQGVKLRTAVWTYRWRWDEIERFELKPKETFGYIPRFRIHLRNGKVKKVRGFFARSSNEEERAQALFKALEVRREAAQCQSSDASAH